MLFDFGARHAKMTAAQRVQIAANLTFNAAHQMVTFIPPGMPVKVASADYARLERQLQEPLDAHIRAALSTRPDLLAKVAVVQAKEAQLRAARADLLPKLSLTGLAG